MAERQKDSKLPPRIPEIPEDILNDEFTFFLACIIAGGEQDSISLVSEPMEHSNPKLLEFVRKFMGPLDYKEALEFERGAHFIFRVFIRMSLPHLRVATVRRFDKELERYVAQLSSGVDLESSEDEDKISSVIQKARDRVVTDFEVPTPFMYKEEKESKSYGQDLIEA